jgi:hypothetical protein
MLALGALDLSGTPASAAGCNSGAASGIVTTDCQATSATDSSSTAVGLGASAGISSTAIGQGASAPGNNSTTFGRGAGSPGGNNVTGLGSDAGSLISVDAATSLGSITSAAKVGSLAVGTFVANEGNHSIAIGGGSAVTSMPPLPADAPGTWAVAIGTGSFARGDESVSVGYLAGDNAGTSNNRNASFGAEAGRFVTGGGNTALGLAAGHTVSGDLNSAFGNSAGQKVTGTYNTAGGVLAGGMIKGSYNTAYGLNAGINVTGNGNLALGLAAGRSITADNTISIGRAARAGGATAVAIGMNSRGIGNSSVAIGTKATASHLRSVAIGSGSITTGPDTVSVGAKGHLRRIVNVGAAVGTNDAVTLSQVKALVRAQTAAPSDPIPAVVVVGAAGANRDGPVLAAAGRQSVAARSARSDGEAPTMTDMRKRKPALANRELPCELGRSKVVTATADRATNSANFSSVTGTSISFRQGGIRSGCVALSLSAEAVAPGHTAMEVRAVLNGGVEAAPGIVSFTRGDATFSPRSFTFVFTNVPPGSHQVEIQFRNAGAAGTVRVGRLTIRLQFATTLKPGRDLTSP